MKQDYFRYLSIALFLLIIVLAYLLLKPYLITILSSFILAYFFYPIYKRLNRIIKNKSLASLTLIFFIILIFLVPTLFLINILIEQSADVFLSARNIDLTILSESLPFSDELNDYARDAGSKGFRLILTSLSNFALTIPAKLFNTFIMVFLLYYLFKDGKTLVAKIKEAIPLRKKDKEKIFEHLKQVMDATLYGIVFTAIIQGLVGMIGLFIFKISSPILLGLLMIGASMLPYVGAALVWLPISIYKIAVQDYFNGIGLLIYGIFIISLVDNLVRPMIISRKARIHPAITLLGIVGGLSLFGFPGIVLGPVLLAVSLTLFEIFLVEGA